MRLAFFAVITLLILGCSDSNDSKVSKENNYNPSMSDSLTRIVIHNWRRINADTAILYLGKAQLLDSTNWSAFANISNFYLRKKDFANYKANYERMTKLFPEYWNSYYQLGLLEVYQNNDTIGASQYFNAALQGLMKRPYPKDSLEQFEYEYKKADLLYACGRKKEAKDIIDSLKAKVYPENISLMLQGHYFKTLEERLADMN